MENEKRNIFISIILGLILIIISSSLGDITNDVYSFVGEFITYKWLINVLLILVLGILLIIYHYRNYSKRGGKEILDNQNTFSESKILKEEKELDQVQIQFRNKRILANLSKDEKELLREYINNDTKTRTFSIQNGTAMGLKAYNVLYMSSNITRGRSLMFPFNIETWAWEMLKENPKYLK